MPASPQGHVRDRCPTDLGNDRHSFGRTRKATETLKYHDMQWRLHAMKRLLLALMLLWLAALAQPALATDTVYYYYTNPLHSAVVVTDTHGNVVERTYYAPYGRVLNRSMRDGPGYTGHEEDPETNLVYMQQRYYDPETGRFLSIDPVSPTSDGTGFNRYEYANDNPYRYTDPDGRASIITYNSDGSISIQIPIIYNGPAATTKNIAFISSAVASRWSGLYVVNGAITNVKVSVTGVSANTPAKAINNITLLNGPTSDKASQGASFVNGDLKGGEWNMNSGGIGEGEVAHEAGHLMGESHDYYTSGTDANGKRTSDPFSGHENDLMGRLGSGANPTNGDMNTILNNPLNVIIDNPPPPPPPPPPSPPQN